MWLLWFTFKNCLNLSLPLPASSSLSLPPLCARVGRGSVYVYILYMCTCACGVVFLSHIPSYFLRWTPTEPRAHWFTRIAVCLASKPQGPSLQHLPVLDYRHTPLGLPHTPPCQLLHACWASTLRFSCFT